MAVYVVLVVRADGRRFRDVVAVGALAGLLGLAFTTALSGARDPDYAMHPFDIEVHQEVAASLDCEQLRIARELLEEPTSSSPDWEYRRDVERAHRLLDCND